MALLATESAAGIGTSPLTGRTLDNANGGTESFVWTVQPTVGEPCYGNGSNQIGFGTNSFSSVRDSRIRKIRTKFNPNSGTSAVMISAFARNDASTLNPRRIGILFVSSQTVFRLFETSTVGGAYTTRASKTITAPGAPVEIELDATTGTTVFARMFAADGVTLLHEISYNFVNLPQGSGWGVGGAQGGVTGFFDDVALFDGPTVTPPVLGTPVAEVLGASSASFTVSTDKAGGNLYALFSNATPDDNTVVSTGVAFAVTAIGTQTGSLSGLPNAATGKIHLVHVLPTLERSAVGRSNTVTLADPLPAPDTTVVTTIGTSGGLLAVIVSGVATNTASLSVSLPAAATPNGAVTRPAQNVVPDGSGNWSVPFVEPPYGTYAPATLILSNIDHPVVNKSGERGVDLIPIEGSDPPETGGDTSRPVMVGVITISAKTFVSYTSAVEPATDDVGVTGYRVSEDGGSTWIDKGTARTHDHTGRTPGTTDQVRWSARDAAGNWATPLAVAVVLGMQPVLSTPTGMATSSTTATGTVSTNKLGGTLYALDSTATPNAATIKAGTSAAVTAPGTQTVATTGLVEGTTGYRRHYVWTDADGVDSAIVRSEPFNTPSEGTLPPGPGGVMNVSPGMFFDALARVLK